MLTDLRFTIRSLLKAPGFTVIAVLTLALGIGATTAIFSVVNTVLLKPLPYVQPERLARIYTEFPSMATGGGMDPHRATANVPEYLDLKRETTLWSSIEGWMDFGGVNIAASSEPSRTTASFVTGGLLHTLGVRPALGRIITPEDAKPGAPMVTVISYGLWKRLFGGQPSILGREILLNGQKHVVVGVMPIGFAPPVGIGQTETSEIWIPLQIDPAKPGERGSHNLNLLGRLKLGVTLQQAQTELNTLVEQWGRTTSGGDHFDPKDHTIAARDLHDETVRAARPALRMLLGAVCFLLLIACVNVANLLLARAETRRQEIAIRGALGAGLWRLAGQFVAEGIALSLLGACVGLLLAKGGLELIKFAAQSSIPRAAEIGVDSQVLLFALVVSVITGLLFGMAPFVHVLKRNLHGAMKSAAASTDAAGPQRFREALVVSQLALALVLLTGTGLMLRAFWKLQDVDAGFDPHSVVALVIGTSGSTVTTHDLLTRLDERLNALPGVRSAALATALPPAPPGVLMGVGTKIEGVVSTQSTALRESPQYPGMYSVDYYRLVSRRYLDTLGIRLVEGRFFDERDDQQAPQVAVINQSMARIFWGNKSPLGRRIAGFGGDERTVIGVVADVKNDGLEKPVSTEVYLPSEQSAGFFDFLGFVNVAIRSDLGTPTLVSAVRHELKQIDPRLPVVKVSTMDELMSNAQSRPRFLTLLLTAFAAVALSLAAVGLYGVISYAVAQRTKEFGIRMAIGAQQGSVLGLVLRWGLRLAAFGLAVGLAGAFVLTRFLSGFLFGVASTDPVTFASVSLLLSTIAILASYLPARRATQVDPLVALRAE